MKFEDIYIRFVWIYYKKKDDTEYRKTQSILIGFYYITKWLAKAYSLALFPLKAQTRLASRA